MPRRSQLRIGYSGTFVSQGSFGTALANGAITKVFSLSDEEPKLVFVTQDLRVIDCTGQYLLDEIILARQFKLNFGIYAEADVLYGLLGWQCGVISDPNVYLLSPTAFQPPANTLLFGYAGGAQNPLKLFDMVMNKLTIQGRIRDRIKASIEMIGHGNPTQQAVTFADCEEPTIVQMKDCAFEINSVTQLANTREFELSLDNKLLADDDPYTLASIDITRMERADERETLMKATILGERGDTLEAASRTNPKTHYPFLLRIGSASDGVSVFAADAVFRQRGDVHDGQARRSAYQYELEPTRIAGDSTTPIEVERLT